MFSRKVSPRPPRTLGDLRICSRPAMLRPTSKMRWFASPILPRLPWTSPTTRPTCWSSRCTLAPTCPICAVIWAENWASSCRTVLAVSASPFCASFRAASTSRWRRSMAWSGSPRRASMSPRRAASRNSAQPVTATAPARITRSTAPHHGITGSSGRRGGLDSARARGERRPTTASRAPLSDAPASPVHADRPEPARLAHPGVTTVQALAGHTLVTEREVVPHGVVRVEAPEAGGDLLDHSPVAAAPPREADGAGHVLDVRVHGHEQRGGRDASPDAEVRRLATDHPAQVEVETLARSARRGQREPVLEAVGEPAARKDRGEILLEEALGEVLESRADVSVLGGVPLEEEGLEGTMTGEEPLGGETEGEHVALAIESIAEAAKEPRVLLEVEAPHETGGRLAHAFQDPGDPGAEEIDTAVGHAGSKEPDQLDVGWVTIAAGKLDRVLLDAPGPVELATELVEGLLESMRGGHPCAYGRDSSMQPRRLPATVAALPRALLSSVPGGHIMIKVGIVGMGVIGRHVADAITKGIPGVALAGVTVRDPAKAGSYRALPLDTLIRESDLILEAATQAALREFAPSVLAAGKHLMVLSVGGLVGVLDEWAQLAEKHGCRILVPSGAVAGLDGMKGAREASITSVTMETRKPPRGLAGAPWIEQQKIDLDAITTETLIFEGPATEAVKAFPANVNVVAAVSLASVGPEKTRIRIYAVPGQARNQHRVVVEGEFGRLAVEIENVPSENPRTGKLSYLSAIAMLRELGAPLQIGN